MKSHWKVRIPCKVLVLVSIGNRSCHTPQDTVNLHRVGIQYFFFVVKNLPEPKSAFITMCAEQINLPWPTPRTDKFSINDATDVLHLTAFKTADVEIDAFNGFFIFCPRGAPTTTKRVNCSFLCCCSFIPFELREKVQTETETCLLQYLYSCKNDSPQWTHSRRQDLYIYNIYMRVCMSITVDVLYRSTRKKPPTWFRVH